MAKERELTEDMSPSELAGAMLDNTQIEIGDSVWLSEEDFAKEISEDSKGEPDDGEYDPAEMDEIPTEVEEGDDEDGESDEDEPDDAGEEEEGDEPDDRPEDEAEARDDAPQERNRPPSRLIRQERERRIQSEQELAAARARIAAYENEQRRQSAPEQGQQAPEAPDPIYDPNGFRAHLRAELKQEMRFENVNATLNRSHREHGKKFEAAYTALMSLNPHDPMARATVQRIWDDPNAGDALMDWHKRQETFNQIGDDPEAFIQREIQRRLRDPETRRATLASLREEAMQGDDGRPRTQTRLPRSLNGAAGGGRGRREVDPELYNDSDASVFAYAMKD